MPMLTVIIVVTVRTYINFLYTYATGVHANILAHTVPISCFDRGDSQCNMHMPGVHAQLATVVGLAIVVVGGVEDAYITSSYSGKPEISRVLNNNKKPILLF